MFQVVAGNKVETCQGKQNFFPWLNFQEQLNRRVTSCECTRISDMINYSYKSRDLSGERNGSS